jgi:dTDP-glucose 4,6-dehydratase
VYNLLEMSRQYSAYRREQNLGFKFIQISTDEVYGSLKATDPSSVEGDAYYPRSPYSASKAAADHLCMAYYHTYGLPVIVTNCCNNYGPRQYPEKFIPVGIRAALQGLPIPVYGKGENFREWIHVYDHCDALEAVLKDGQVGEQYNIGAPFTMPNRELAMMIAMYCGVISSNTNDIYQYVTDRPGHDFRYSLNSDKIEKQLNWKWSITLDNGLEETVKWYKNEFSST